MSKLIGFAGVRRSGKDTAASFLVERGFKRVAFADKLKDAVANLFGIDREMVDELKLEDSVGCKGHVILQIDGTVEYDFSWIEFLQRFGTEMARETFWWDFWAELALPNFPVVDTVITDVRFDNEAARILRYGGYVIEIKRPGHEPSDHASEAGIDPDLIDYTIVNDGSLDKLKGMVLSALVR